MPTAAVCAGDGGCTLLRLPAAALFEALGNYDAVGGGGGGGVGGMSGGMGLGGIGAVNLVAQSLVHQLELGLKGGVAL